MYLGTTSLAHCSTCATVHGMMVIINIDSFILLRCIGYACDQLDFTAAVLALKLAVHSATLQHFTQNK